MANVSGAVQIETGIKHGLSIPFQSVAGEQSIDVGTLLRVSISLIASRKPMPKSLAPTDTRPAGITGVIARSGGLPYPIARHRRLVLMGCGPIGSLRLRRRRPLQCANVHRDQMRDKR